jgi:hypothetical protein
LKRIILHIILLLISATVAAQDTLSGQYENLRLLPGLHLVKGVVSVNGPLEAEAGARLLFDEGASLVCYGSVQLLGNEVNRVVLQSQTGKKSNGLVIRGVAPGVSVQIAYTRFTELLVPLRFEGEWYRQSVSISQSEFINNNSPNAIVYVMPPRFEPGKENPVINFTIGRTLFSGNRSPVYFEDLTSDNLKISVSDNLFMSNRLADYGVFNFSGNILFGRADSYSSTFQALFTGNSFLQNYLLNLSADTVLRESTIGVYGTLDSLTATSNFWGYTNTPSIRLNIYDYYSNYTAPKLLIDPFLPQPGALTPPHVFSATLETSTGQEIGAANLLLGSGFQLQQEVQSRFRLRANRPLRFSTGKLRWFYLDDSLVVREQSIATSFVSAPIDREASIEIDASTLALLKRFPGYLEIADLSGENNEFVPQFYIGYRSFLRLKKQTIDKDKAARLRSAEPDRPKTSELAAMPNAVPGITPVTAAFVQHHTCYVMGMVNSSMQTINDAASVGQFIYPVDQLGRNGFSLGGGAGLRWTNHYTKHLSYGASLTYAYLRPAQSFLNTDSVDGFTGRFVGFVPRSFFHFVGLQGFACANYSDLRLTLGGAMEINLSPFAPLDTEGFNSYRDLMYSLFAGIEYEFDPFTTNKRSPGYLLGVRFRRGFPMLAVKDVTNTTDMVEFYIAAEVEPLTKLINKLKSKKR